MKALSNGLIRGHIDEVEQRVTVDWIQPRVLDQSQVLMQRRLKYRNMAACVHVYASQHSLCFDFKTLGTILHFLTLGCDVFKTKYNFYSNDKEKTRIQSAIMLLFMVILKWKQVDLVIIDTENLQNSF